MNHIPMPILIMDTIMRFWDKVNKTGSCWLWTAYTDEDGYGGFKIDKKTYRATRIAYWMFYQKDPGDLDVLHECNNPPCVNPAHLFLGTPLENTRHCVLEGRRPKHGSLNGQAKSTGETITKIRSLKGEFSYSELGRMFNYSTAHINDIMNYKKWKHI